MRKLALTALFLCGLAASAGAQNVSNPLPPQSVNGAYNSVAPTCTDGNGCWLQTDVNGNLKTVSSGAPVGTQEVDLLTSADATSGTLSAQSTAAASNLVIKASAGNLYEITVSVGATAGYLMLFNATSLPSNGAVTPVYCVPVDSNGTNGWFSKSFFPPKGFATGITAGFSTTGCFTLTASATASFFSGYR